MSELWSIFLGTLLAEDASLAWATHLVGVGRISPFSAFLACTLGIGLGDFLLYLFGRFLIRIEATSNRKFLKRLKARYANKISTESLSALICVSRFIPGTRLPTYIGAGLLSFGAVRFLVLTAASVLIWVSLTFFAGAEIHEIVGGNWICATLLFLVALTLIKKSVRMLSNRWSRKAFFYSWEKWLYFEFWPAYVFYAPVFIWYALLSIRYRNPLLPLYSNPDIENGGLIGESKWDLYRPMMTEDSEHWLKTKLIAKGERRFEAVQRAMEHESIGFPFILKPDQGQRGYGVRVIRDLAGLQEYLETYDCDVLLQEWCPWPNEAGIFYYRLPGELEGHLFSITEKRLPYVVGDGRSPLGDLILKDKRARLIATTYFVGLRPLLDSVPEKGEKIRLTETGNHCKGAIFTNGNSLSSRPLLEKIDSISNRIPEFYFGRFDVRYENNESLKLGRSFKIVELNGAGSEATHIWDRKTSLREAYRVLFQQWGVAFEIGSRIKKSQPKARIRLALLFREWIVFLAMK